jgi:hypothetical protein
LGENDVVREREFDRYTEDVNRRLARLEGRVDALETEHDSDMAALATQREREARQARERRERRREWTWGQLTATAVAAIALGALFLQALGR